MILDMTVWSDMCAHPSTPSSHRRAVRLLGMACVAFVLSMATNGMAIEPEAGPDSIDDTADVEYEYDYAADTEAGTVDEFKDELEPHGTWVDDPTYGTVWVPDKVVVGNDFQPYRTNGKWAVTDEGDWVFLSDYDWGYIPFHYGRWVYTSPRGWVWIPGRVYAPAWVVWRTGSPGYDYLGWAPAPPSYVWVNGFAVGFYASYNVPWWYCSSNYFFSPFWHRHWVTNRYQIGRIHRHTRVHHHYHGRRHRRASGTSSSGHRKATGRKGSTKHRPAAGRAGSGTEAKSNKSGSKKVSSKAANKGISPKGKKDNARAYAKTGIPKSPNFKQARISKKAQPKTRVKPNQKALGLRKPFPKKAKTGSKSTAGKKRYGKTSKAGKSRSRSRYGKGSRYNANRGSRYGKRSRSTMFPKKNRGNRTSRYSQRSRSRSGVSTKSRSRYTSRSRPTRSSRSSSSRAKPRSRTTRSRTTRSRTTRSRPTRSRTTRSRSTRSRPSTRSRSRSSSKSRSRSSSKSRSRSSSKSRSRSRRR